MGLCEEFRTPRETNVKAQKISGTLSGRIGQNGLSIRRLEKWGPLSPAEKGRLSVVRLGKP